MIRIKDLERESVCVVNEVNARKRVSHKKQVNALTLINNKKSYLKVCVWLISNYDS